MAQNILLWSYLELQNELFMFEFDSIPKNANDFASASVKGGAVYASLRKLSLGANPMANVVIYTDADISTSLLQSGLLMAPLFPLHGRRQSTTQISVGSRRVGDSVMVRDETRNAMSLLYNGLTRVLFGLDISDTQMGFKAIRSDIIPHIHRGFSELEMAFDVELLWIAKAKGYSMKEVGCVWIDSGKSTC